MNTNSDIFAAKEAKNNFGRLLDTAQSRPVTIQKKGRNVAVVLSYGEYERLEKLDDIHWATKATEAKTNGDFLDQKESREFLNGLLHETDRTS